MNSYKKGRYDNKNTRQSNFGVTKLDKRKRKSDENSSDHTKSFGIIYERHLPGSNRFCLPTLKIKMKMKLGNTPWDSASPNQKVKNCQMIVCEENFF